MLNDLSIAWYDHVVLLAAEGGRDSTPLDIAHTHLEGRREGVQVYKYARLVILR